MKDLSKFINEFEEYTISGRDYVDFNDKKELFQKIKSFNPTKEQYQKLRKIFKQRLEWVNIRTNFQKSEVYEKVAQGLQYIISEIQAII